MRDAGSLLSRLLLRFFSCVPADVVVAFCKTVDILEACHVKIPLWFSTKSRNPAKQIVLILLVYTTQVNIALRAV